MLARRRLAGFLFLWGVFSTAANAALHQTELLSFHFAKFGALSGGGAPFIGGLAQFAWAPQLELGTVDVRGEIGLTFFKDPAGTEFSILNYELFAAFDLVWLLLELGGGIQVWGGTYGAHPDLGANIALPFSGYLDRFFLGYSRVLFPVNSYNAFKVGVGFTF